MVLNNPDQTSITAITRGGGWGWGEGELSNEMNLECPM